MLVHMKFLSILVSYPPAKARGLVAPNKIGATIGWLAATLALIFRAPT